MTVFVTSDNHWNHEKIIGFCNRPFDSLQEMNERMIHAWNAVVGPKDDVWILGDWAFSHPDGIEIDALFRSLNGVKKLVKGNHDEKNPKVLRQPWDDVMDLATIRHEGMRFVACHYPMETWKNAAKGYVMLHGHSHGSLRRVIPHRFDVGVDVVGYAPVPIETYWHLAQQQSFSPQDHHGD